MEDTRDDEIDERETERIAELADGAAKEQAHEAANDAYAEAYNEVYEETYKEAYEEACKNYRASYESHKEACKNNPPFLKGEPPKVTSRNSARDVCWICKSNSECEEKRNEIKHRCWPTDLPSPSNYSFAFDSAADQARFFQMCETHRLMEETAESGN